ncbi:MAG: DUF1003 domain-containing protein [Candidatus Liptonbacteria bacterium]|nr:DUF1003 domain-containing protein [Candidatus Liptonbacteria bacterium]
MRHTPVSLENLKKLKGSVRNINAEHYEHLSGLEKFAVRVTQKVGTMRFFFIIFSWTALWVGWNILGPAELRFDPYPAFVLWLIISNAIQISLMPLIMIGQNLQGKHSEARSEADYELNSRTEKETEAILMHLENQNEMLSQILQNLESKGKK